jgi:hypothetical protein
MDIRNCQNIMIFHHLIGYPCFLHFCSRLVHTVIAVDYFKTYGDRIALQD